MFLQEKCLKFYCESTIPFAYILVKKSDETKFFTQYNSFNYRNPLPGTIVDSDITDPNMWVWICIEYIFYLRNVISYDGIL